MPHTDGAFDKVLRHSPVRQTDGPVEAEHGSNKKAPRPRKSGAGHAPARSGLGEQALRWRENYPATLHCAEQPARAFYCPECHARVVIKCRAARASSTTQR
jgi:hypothetical protein